MFICRKSLFVGQLWACLALISPCWNGAGWNQAGHARADSPQEVIEAETVIQTAADRRLHRILTGRSDKSRNNMIAKLSAAGENVHRDIKVVIQATRDLMQQRADAIDGEDDAQPEEISSSVSGLLWVASASPSPLVESLLVDAVGHADPMIAMTAMDVVGKLRLDAAVEQLAEQIKRPVYDQRYAFRFALIRSIANLHHPRAVELLGELVGQLDGQLRHEVIERLNEVDVRDFEGDADELDSWQAAHPISDLLDRVYLDVEPEREAVEPASAIKLKAISSSSQRRPKLAKSQYYGIDLTAARMLFIIDNSGSMNEAAHYGTRLQSAKSELVRTINGLSPDTEFGLMIFDTTVNMYRDELIPASTENKRDATTFIERVRSGDRTNTYGALSKATEFDDQLEAVFVLTDGQPTYGEIKRPDLIIDRIVRRNQMRHLKFHTIGIGHLGNTAIFLRTLAEETGGEFRQVP
ncbi:VWA domain-containing protein [Neorhodopirellula lusitana]|uniref:VWA domain-containing protein n=1 Tax=Neorhodopirellula lusitana TaxID=445327 RepID=UPI00385098C1